MRRTHRARPSRRHLRERLVGRRAALTALALALCLAGAAGGTLAWLIDHTQTIQNTFKPSHVDCEVVELSLIHISFRRLPGVYCSNNIRPSPSKPPY